MADPIPQGFHTVTPSLVLRDCAKAIAFYERALGAQQVSRMDAPDGSGSVWHAELRIGDSIVFVNDQMGGMPPAPPTPEHPSPATLWVYVPDCDRAYRQAVDAGATSTMAPADMFWGDRMAGVADPYGYIWSFATRKKDLSPDEMRRAGAEMARQWKERQAGAKK